MTKRKTIFSNSDNHWSIVGGVGLVFIDLVVVQFDCTVEQY